MNIQRANNLISKGVRFIGYVPTEGVSDIEYKDYIKHMGTMPKTDVEVMLSMGNFPPGLVILPDGGIPGVIVSTGKKQRIEVWKPSQGIRIG